MSRSRTLRAVRRERRKAVRAHLAPKLTQPLLAAWDHACWALAQVFAIFTTPATLALREYVTRAEHRRLADLVRHLELLTRRIVLAAALCLNLVLKPAASHAHRPRTRRRVLRWPERPETWRAHFRMMPPRTPEERLLPLMPRPGHITPVMLPSLPLARRLEAVRRALAAPDACVRRFAIRMERITTRNRTANRLRLFALREWPASARISTHGRRFIETGMAIALPIAESRLDAWNEAMDPG